MPRSDLGSLKARPRKYRESGSVAEAALAKRPLRTRQNIDALSLDSQEHNFQAVQSLRLACVFSCRLNFVIKQGDKQINSNSCVKFP